MTTVPKVRLSPAQRRCLERAVRREMQDAIDRRSVNSLKARGFLVDGDEFPYRFITEAGRDALERAS